MKAVDTNILVRWITRDDPVQAPLADIVMGTPVFVSHTVLIELVWTLRGKTYRFERSDTADVLDGIVALATTTTPFEEGVRWAIDRFAAGADFADMIHLIGSRGADHFVTFERRLSQQAGPDTPLPIERPS